MVVLPFRADANGTLAATTASNTVALAAASNASQMRTVRLYNAGPNEAFVRFGTSAVTATAGGAITNASDGDYSMPPGVVELLYAPAGATHMAGVTATGTATLRIATGEGM